MLRCPPQDIAASRPLCLRSKLDVRSSSPRLVTRPEILNRPAIHPVVSDPIRPLSLAPHLRLRSQLPQYHVRKTYTAECHRSREPRRRCHRALSACNPTHPMKSAYSGSKSPDNRRAPKRERRSRLRTTGRFFAAIRQSVLPPPRAKLQTRPHPTALPTQRRDLKPTETVVLDFSPGNGPLPVVVPAGYSA